MFQWLVLWAGLGESTPTRAAAPSLHHHRDHDTDDDDDDDSVTVVLAVSDAGPALCPCGQQVALLSLACWLVGTGAAGAAGFCWFLLVSG